MAGFLIAVTVFLAGHIIPGLLRERLVRRIGYRPYIIAFSILSVLLFGWVIHEVLVAESFWLWDYQTWQAQLLVVVMLPACILWACAILQPCPLSIGRKTGFDPAKPGINRFCRHPLLLGMILWGAGHTIANGDIVAVLFFGGSSIFALIGFWRMEKIRLRGMTNGEQAILLAATRRFSLSGLKDAFRGRDILAGIVLYLLILGGHGHVIGVDPLAMAGW
ncbi:NnrU family protein [Thalassospira profundimaris]|uniref:NnrU family protein n=1 Tax=Thalassospira indica TaxID=1891279 RepID=A0ABM6XVU6_9PROT|nr:NnrU family protein [Thalassospira indica]OAZ14508.1 NnrU family protein [Thalassospira profundimaris]